jgi:fructose-specific PTS system IIA-like component
LLVGEIQLPRLLDRANAELLRGTSVVPGIGRGRIVRLNTLVIPEALLHEPASSPDAVIAQLDEGLRVLDQQYDEQLAAGSGGVAAAVLEAHQAIARDPALHEYLVATARQAGGSAAAAIAAAEAHFSAMLVDSGSLLLRERALDIRDVCNQLFNQIYFGGEHHERTRLTTDSVCIADNLTPGEFLALDRNFLNGLVLSHSASTSHTIVLARSFGIPTLTGVAGLGNPALDGREVIIDADLGVLVTEETPAVRRYYELEDARLAGRHERLSQSANKPAATSDGCRLEIGANIATAAEAAPAFAAGADGIGLFRTEMLFVNRDDPPGEEEQFEEYRQALAAASGKPVIIRMLDIGGDKPVPYLRLPKEENPFLGFRAVRMYPEFHSLVRTQVRALVRASAFGQLKVMVPMISRLDEVAWVRQVIIKEQARCAAAGIAHDPVMPIGAMVEVPAMAFQLDHFCRVLDFFSIGTNDLLQYFLAVDRTSDRIAGLYEPMAPAFLRLLKKIVDDIHQAGRWVGVCGELGGLARALPLLVGLGVDELSMAAPGIATTKAAVHELIAGSCRTLLDQAITCESEGDVDRLIGTFNGRRPVPLLSPDLMLLDADCATREEAIKTLVDQLYITGRTDDPREVEAAVWQREQVYSTGFGHGFAIPHCKSDAVKANSLAILRLQQPVAWESLDGKPVSVLVLLAIRESDRATSHLKILATLARQLMHEGFRERLVGEQNPDALCRILLEHVGG